MKLLLDKKTEEILKLYIKTEQNTQNLKRAQVILLKAKNFSAKIISDITCYTIGTVYHIVRDFREKNMQGVIIKKKGGRYRYHLSLSQEKQLIKQFEKQSKIGGVLDVFKIKKEYEKIIGKEVSESTVYRMLKRHN